MRRDRAQEEEVPHGGGAKKRLRNAEKVRKGKCHKEEERKKDSEKGRKSKKREVSKGGGMKKGQ